MKITEVVTLFTIRYLSRWGCMGYSPIYPGFTHLDFRQKKYPEGLDLFGGAYVIRGEKGASSWRWRSIAHNYW